MVSCWLPAILLALVGQNPMTPPQGASFQQARLLEQLAKTGGSYLPFLDVPTLHCGLYRLAKGATDGQSPHDQDEVYCVLSGKAVLEIADQRHAAEPGAVLFVAAQVPHRFVDISEDLEVMVFFSRAVPVTGGMAAARRQPTRQTPYPETSPRGSTRIFYWYGPGSAGQVEIDYGLPRWQPAYAGMLAQATTQRWRFGQNFWTRLDSNIELTIGGTSLPAGYYYLVLESDADAGPRLIALDPAEIREQLLDAYQAPATTGGIAIPLERADDGVPSDHLHIELSLDPDEADHGLLQIRFGPHRLTAPIELHPD